MDYSDPDFSLHRPIGAGATYRKVMRETENSRDLEIRAFEHITAELEAAGDPEAPFNARVAALHRNRELWLTLTCDLADDRNALPEPLRARLIGIGIWVFRETRRLISDRAPLSALVAVNRSILCGLVAASEGAC